MKLTSVLVVFCCGALTTLTLEHAPLSHVLAAVPQQGQQPKTETLPIRPEQPQPKDQGKTVILPIQTGKPLGTIGELEWYVIGLQYGVKELQDQMKTMEEETKTLKQQAATDQATIRTLQVSLQTLQGQFANHSHKVDFPVAGHPCVALDEYNLHNASTGNTDLVALFHTTVCRTHGVDPGFTPTYTTGANVSTPVQGAQTGALGIQ